MSSKSVFKNYLFAAFLVVLVPLWLYEEFNDRYPKKPVSVTNKISVTIIIKAFITADEYTAKDLAAKIH